MIDAVLGILGTILYPLFAIFFVLIDLVQAIFRSFAGIGDASYRKSTFNYDNITSGQYKEDSKWGGILDDDNGGLVYYLLRSDLVMNLVWSIATLALILLIVFTVIAFIKNIYAPKSKSWQEIIGLSVKGLFNFIFIPVVCLLGIILGNILLNAIDGATSTGGATTMSRKLFLSAAYDANWIRMGNTVSYNQANRAIDLHNSVFKKGIAKVTVPQGKKGSDAIEGADVEYYANLVDEAYGTGGVFLTDHHNWISVEANYSLPRINYLTLAVGGVFMMYALGSISFGMVKRLFTLLVLFIISPAACAMYPLDEGNACKQITGDFKKNTISAYGAVAGMNLFMSIAPMIENINIAGSDAGGVITDIIGVNSILHLILLVCGLFMVKDLISMISNYFGAGNAYADGSSMMKSVKDKVGGQVTKTVSTFAKAKGAHEAGGSFFGSLREQSLKDALSTFTGINVKGIKDAKKEGKEHAFDYDKERNDRLNRKKAQEILNEVSGTHDIDVIDDKGNKVKRTLDMSKMEDRRLWAKEQHVEGQFDDLLAARENRSNKREAGKTRKLTDAKGIGDKFKEFYDAEEAEKNANKTRERNKERREEARSDVEYTGKKVGKLLREKRAAGQEVNNARADVSTAQANTTTVGSVAESKGLVLDNISRQSLDLLRDAIRENNNAILQWQMKREDSLSKGDTASVTRIDAEISKLQAENTTISGQINAGEDYIKAKEKETEAIKRLNDVRDRAIAKEKELIEAKEKEAEAIRNRKHAEEELTKSTADLKKAQEETTKKHGKLPRP